MRRLTVFAFIAASSFGIVNATSAGAADVVVAVPVPRYAVVPVRRQLTTYMAKYPFGVLREDYTPLGAPGVSKRDYYGVPRLYATLHASPRRWARRHDRRVIVSARY